jgi:hypothetical protein
MISIKKIYDFLNYCTQVGDPISNLAKLTTLPSVMNTRSLNIIQKIYYFYSWKHKNLYLNLDAIKPESPQPAPSSITIPVLPLLVSSPQSTLDRVF